MILAIIGGLFAAFTFIHLISDWIFQTHAEAMAKHHDPLIRARHCAIYTAFFIPVFLFVLHAGGFEIMAYCAILYLSHFWEDTYRPVVWWMKHMRAHPAMHSGRDEVAAFKEIIAEPLGSILMIAVDQIVHLTFLMVIAILYTLIHHLGA